MIALLAVGALAHAASAQQVLFQETFEGGLGAWTATGLWNLEGSSDPCGSTFGPFPSGVNVAWYGIDGACTYDTPRSTNSGVLSGNDWIDLPPTAASISLRYWASSKTEDCGEGYDFMAVRVVVQGGSPAGILHPYCAYSPGIDILDAAWHERRIDWTALAGMRVRFGFEFDTLDPLNNGYRGWLVDDVRILVEPGVRVCPPTTFFSACPCLPIWLAVAGGCRNSTGQSATLYSEGVASLAADSLRFRAVLMPASANALLVQGAASGAPTTFGDGLRCVGGPMIRMGMVTASSGSATWPPPGTSSISVRGSVPGPGSSRFYSAYYRDTAAYCTAAQFNSTDAQRIDWGP